MDILSDLFLEAGLSRRLLDLSRLPADGALRFPCERSMGFHVVTRGPVWLHAPGLPEPLAMATGDVALMARGCDHVMAPSASLEGLLVQPMPAAERLPPKGGGEGVEPDVDVSATLTRPVLTGPSLISAAYQLWNAPLHPFFSELPAWHVVRGDPLPRLGGLSLAVALLGQEAGQQQAGSEQVVNGLLDVLLVYLVREWMAAHATGAGFSLAQRDPPVRRAVALMHADCAHPWTLEQLAQQVGVSRTVLAERFRQAMGDTPLNYLRTVRLQKAMRLLADTDHKLEQVASEVGYHDAFGFSKAFKRQAGVSPREFRQRDIEDRRSPWRFDATGPLRTASMARAAP